MDTKTRTKALKVTGNFIEIEPSRTNLFIVEFPDELAINSNLVQHVSLPVFENNKWSPIKLDIFELVDGHVNEKIFNFIEHESKNRSFKIIVKMVDVARTELFGWEMKFKKIHKIELGSLSYAFHDNEVLHTVHVEIEPESCKLIKL